MAEGVGYCSNQYCIVLRLRRVLSLIVLIRHYYIHRPLFLCSGHIITGVSAAVPVALPEPASIITQTAIE